MTNTELIQALRNKASRDNRELLDRAAHVIESLTQPAQPGTAVETNTGKIDCNITENFAREWTHRFVWMRDIDDAPTVDAVEVVRCRECKHCDPENHHCDHHMGTAAPLRRKPDDFCSYGERKEGVD